MFKLAMRIRTYILTIVFSITEGVSLGDSYRFNLECEQANLAWFEACVINKKDTTEK